MARSMENLDLLPNYGINGRLGKMLDRLLVAKAKLHQAYTIHS